MTNKTERYFVVSESELEASWTANWHGTAEECEQAEAACRARPVPVWATHFARKETDEEIESGNSPKMSLVYVEEIKK